MFYQTKKKSPFQHAPFRTSAVWCLQKSDRDLIEVRRGSSVGASPEIDLPQVLNRGLQFDLEVLQWSKLVEAWGAQKEEKTPSCTFARHFCGQLQLLTGNDSPRN